MALPQAPVGPRSGFARRNRNPDLVWQLPDESLASQSEVSSAATSAEDLRHISWEHASSEYACQKHIEINNILQGCPFFVLDLVHGTSFYGATTTDLTAIPREIPNNALAIIVTCKLSRTADVESCLRDLRAAKKPIIVLCVDDGVRFNTHEILDVHDRFLDLGASDFVLHGGPSKYLHVDLLMRVRSALRADQVRGIEVEKRLEEQQKTMVWPFVHRILPGFPKLSKADDSQIKSRKIMQRMQAGTFGTVFKCANVAEGQHEVMKAIPKSPLNDFKKVMNIWNEIVLLQKLQHPNVVACKYAKQTATEILIFMDFAGPRNLLAYLRKSSVPSDELVIPISTSINITGQILAGLSHCHENGIAHRDLKPENIVVMDVDGSLRIRIVDFGLAIESTKACTDLVGTFPFIAPEVIARSKHDQYDPACADMWSCGVIFLEVLCGAGKLNRMLQWNDCPSPRSQYRKDLEDFFSIESRITASVEADIGLKGSASFPGNVQVSLVGLLRPDPSCRCNAKMTIEALTQDTGFVVTAACD